MAHRWIAALIATACVAGGGGAEDAPGPAVVAPSAASAAPPARHAGVASRPLGPEIALSPGETAAAQALVTQGARAGTWSAYGGSSAYFVGDTTVAPPETMQPRLLWIARASTDVAAQVAALNHLDRLATAHTDWPADHEALLAGLVTHADPHVASAAVLATNHALLQSTALTALIRETCTEHTSPVVRAEACSALGMRAHSLSEDEPALSALAEALSDEEAIVQVAALSVIGGVTWSTHLPSGTYDVLVALVASPEPIVRARALADVVAYAGSNGAATPAQRTQAAALVVTALSDASGWVRAEAMTQASVLNIVGASYDRMVVLLDDPAPLDAEMPFEPLALDGGPTLPHVYATSLGSYFQPSTVGTWSLSTLSNIASGGNSGRIPAEQRLTLSDGSSTETSRTETLAWWTANRAVVAASQ